MQTSVGMTTVLGGAATSLYGAWNIWKGGKSPAEKEQRRVGIQSLIGGIAIMAFGALLILNPNEKTAQESSLEERVSSLNETSPLIQTISDCFSKINNACNSELLKIFNFLRETGELTCETFSSFVYDKWTFIRTTEMNESVSWGLDKNQCPFVSAQYMCKYNGSSDPIEGVFSLFQNGTDQMEVRGSDKQGFCIEFLNKKSNMLYQLTELFTQKFLSSETAMMYLNNAFK